MQPTGPAQMTLVLALLGLCIPSVFVPWIAAFTETVEDINPALVATGLAVQVFISRWVAVLAVLALPLVVGDGQGWAVWWGICIAGQVGFLPTILTVAGAWNPVRAARGEAPPHVGSGAGPS